MKKILLISFLVLIASMMYSQEDTCVADYCYTAVLDTSTNMLVVSFINNSYALPSSSVIEYSFWDFGDNLTCTCFEPNTYYYNFTSTYYIVSLQIGSSTSCVDTYIDTINFVTSTTCNTISGINSGNNLINNFIDVFPNPTNGIITIKGKDVLKIQVTDINGKVIYQTNTNKQNIDIRNQTRGIYYLKVTTAKGTETKKIIKE